ncbi:hypothetical protein ElyMa_005103300 [Elysia marginata]|uniref:UmuC domain-containing protein n=1 Tax=Elysia marginata TaxID=1093978 RepID=A0AAV4JHE7_9GAST|nr:hypothetical protein ElyMa_005103300 [Elysia marginata]
MRKTPDRLLSDDPCFQLLHSAFPTVQGVGNIKGQNISQKLCSGTGPEASVLCTRHVKRALESRFKIHGKSSTPRPFSVSISQGDILVT